ncbi:MAG: L,D-transpeptidase Cds6 family protein, partial [Burkholderiales bacterium]
TIYKMLSSAENSAAHNHLLSAGTLEPASWAKIVVLLLALCAGPAAPMGERPAVPERFARHGDEAMLVKSLLNIERGQLDSALNAIDAVLAVNPNFRLAQLVRGDLLLAHARALDSFGGASGAPADFIAGLRDEARARIRHSMSQTPRDRVPRYLAQLNSDQRYALVVDTGRARLYLYRNDAGIPRYAGDFYISIGKNGAQKLREGDQKTPVGVYFVSGEVPKSALSDFYGAGAFPLDYPNEWDKRLGKNGSGIWLHGTPTDTYSRPPRASNGCIVLSNADLSTLSEVLRVGATPVIIDTDIEWVDFTQMAQRRELLNNRIENWRRDWAKLDTERYLRHYSTAFRGQGYDYVRWTEHKRRVNARKQSLDVTLSNISMFSYPNADDLMVVTFEQRYHSNDLSSKMLKRQYWRLEDGRWKIIYEGAA